MQKPAPKPPSLGTWGKRGMLVGGLIGFVVGVVYVATPPAAGAPLIETIGAVIVCAVEGAVIAGLLAAAIAAMIRRSGFRGDTSRDACVGAVVLSFVLMLYAGTAHAVEGGISPYLKGSLGFMSGYIPTEPGFIVNKSLYIFDGSADASVRNGRIEFGADLNMHAGFLQGAYVTGATLFGGTYAFAGAVAYAKADLTATLDSPVGGTAISQEDDGIADSVIVPIIIGWHAGNWHMNASLPILVPTGDYNLGHLSVGKNVWAFMPQFAVTWFDPMSGWDVSGAFSLVFHGNNDETDYQSGTIFHLDWAIGKHFGAWELGVAGNIVAQISDDSGTGAQLGGFRAESFGLGPAINYNGMLFRRPMTISAKWQPDLSATNTFKGDVIMASLLLVL